MAREPGLVGRAHSPRPTLRQAFDYVTLKTIWGRKTIGGRANDLGKTIRIFDAPGVRDVELVYTKVEVNFRCWR